MDEGWLSDEGRTRNMTIRIDLRNLTSDRIFGLCMIDNKSPITREVLEEFVHLLYTRLHHLLTHLDQEGEMDSDGFSETNYHTICQCIQEIEQFFGEDATVAIDLNLDYYREHAVAHLLGCQLQVEMAVMRDVGWVSCPLVEGRLDEAMALMA